MRYQNITILTGAGISAESGIPTFRASDGLWENHPVEEVATPEGFARDPKLVHRFYNERRAKAGSVEPNAAHLALANLEAQHSGHVIVITQNIDDLHERAGTQNLIHMHGEVFKMKCTKCEKSWVETGATMPADPCPSCDQVATRPDIVWFGEMPYQMEEIWSALEQTDLFLSIGTSGNFYPAAGFAQIANRSGAHCVEINLEPSKTARDFHEKIYGKASDLVPSYIRQFSDSPTEIHHR